MSNATDETKKNGAAASKKGTAATAKKAPAKKAGAKAPAKKAAAKAEGTGRGRSSGYAGHTLTHTVAKEGDGYPNPRREGTHGHKSMKIILDAGKTGISYEDFVKKGGRSNDLAWDIEHGNVATKAPK